MTMPSMIKLSAIIGTELTFVSAYSAGQTTSASAIETKLKTKINVATILFIGNATAQRWQTCGTTNYELAPDFMRGTCLEAPPRCFPSLASDGSGWPLGGSFRKLALTFFTHVDANFYILTILSYCALAVAILSKSCNQLNSYERNHFEAIPLRQCRCQSSFLNRELVPDCRSSTRN